MGECMIPTALTSTLLFAALVIAIAGASVLAVSLTAGAAVLVEVFMLVIAATAEAP